jgi:hypothetical protein
MLNSTHTKTRMRTPKKNDRSLEGQTHESVQIEKEKEKVRG